MTTRFATLIAVTLMFAACKPYLISRDTPNVSDPPLDTSVGLTPHCSDRYKCGYVDQRGHFAVPAVYKVVKPFYEGLAAVYKEGYGWGVIDPEGHYVVQPSFASIGPFSEGLAGACPSDKDLYRWVYIDRSGRTVINMKFKVEQTYPFHNGSAWVRCPFLFSSQMKQIDKNGRVLQRYIR